MLTWDSRATSPTVHPSMDPRINPAATEGSTGKPFPGEDGTAQVVPGVDHATADPRGQVVAAQQSLGGGERPPAHGGAGIGQLGQPAEHPSRAEPRRAGDLG